MHVVAIIMFLLHRLSAKLLTVITLEKKLLQFVGLCAVIDLAFKL